MSGHLVIINVFVCLDNNDRGRFQIDKNNIDPRLTASAKLQFKATLTSNGKLLKGWRGNMPKLTFPHSDAEQGDKYQGG